MRNLALFLALCATLLSACASEAGNPGPGANANNNWVQPSADAGSNDSGNNASADAAPQPQPDQQVVEVNNCVDLSVNDGIYDCQDGNPLTPITADANTCEYYTEVWTSTPDKTKVLDGGQRVIAKTGDYTRDCVRKGPK